MTTTHTPGPWSANGLLIEGPRMGLQVALAYRHDIGNAARDGNQAKANARLIAAAPDLLAALERMVATFEPLCHPSCRRPDDSVSEARAAIAKARGQEEE